ncbi:hypothetical protein ACF059_24650 [Streptomyces sp. NPDC016562]|uniref:hypothetical protein n=1 Tax=Streptomyces sp. NPDC016562 TaxID=3364966 RepID=UPI0036F8F8B6
MGRPTQAARAAITQRRTDAVDLKLAGVDWLTIGRKLAADPAVNSDGIAYPQGYGIEAYRRGGEPPSDARLIEIACKDVSKALAERSTVLDESTDDLRKLMAERWNGFSSGYTAPPPAPATWPPWTAPSASSSAAATSSA